MTKRISEVLRSMVDEREEVYFLLALVTLIALSLFNGPEWMSGVEFGGVIALLYTTLLVSKKVGDK